MAATAKSERMIAASPAFQAIKQRGYLAGAWRHYRRNFPAMAGLVTIIIVVALALGAGLISTHVTQTGPREQDLASRFAGISQDGYLLGSDELGRDTATRLVYGARVSLTVAGVAITASLLIGAGIGMIAGYYGGAIDNLLMRVVDVVFAVPGLFVLMLIAAMYRLGPTSLALVIGGIAWVTLARLVRGEVLFAKQCAYVEAARVAGATELRTMWRHILPNVAPVMIVWASLTIPSLILWEASLSYLGLGVQPPQPSWGNMLSNAQSIWSHAPALMILPGLAIYITVFSINLIGIGLRDALDPRTSR